MDDTALACPFCEGQNLQFWHNQVLPGMETMICNDCGARGPHKHTEAAAVDSWNTRPKPALGDELVERVTALNEALKLDAKTATDREWNDLLVAALNIREALAASHIPDTERAEIVAWLRAGAGYDAPAGLFGDCRVQWFNEVADHIERGAFKGAGDDI